MKRKAKSHLLYPPRNSRGAAGCQLRWIRTIINGLMHLIINTITNTVNTISTINITFNVIITELTTQLRTSADRRRARGLRT